MAVYQQMRRWAKAGVFEAMAHELRAVARLRRFARDYERLSSTLAAFHWFAFAGLLLARIVKACSQSA